MASTSRGTTPMTTDTPPGVVIGVTVVTYGWPTSNCYSGGSAIPSLLQKKKISSCKSN